VGVSSSPTPRPEPVATNAFERASLPLTRVLSQLPPLVPILVVFALVLLGSFLGPWGAIPLGLVVLFLLWMLGLSWPRLTASERLMRIAVIVLLVGLTVIKVVPR
jgi:hypothetical protein